MIQWGGTRPKRRRAELGTERPAIPKGGRRGGGGAGGGNIIHNDREGG